MSIYHSSKFSLNFVLGVLWFGVSLQSPQVPLSYVSEMSKRTFYICIEWPHKSSHRKNFFHHEGAASLLLCTKTFLLILFGHNFLASENFLGQWPLLRLKVGLDLSLKVLSQNSRTTILSSSLSCKQDFFWDNFPKNKPKIVTDTALTRFLGR